MNQVKHGLTNLHVAFAKESGPNGEPLWEQPISIPGAVQFTAAPAGSASNFYGDNGIWYSSNPGGNASGNLQLWDIPPDIKARMLGDYIDEDGRYIEVNGQGAIFALLGQQDGTVSNTRFVYYKCTAAKAEKAYDTNTDTIQAKQDNCTITATRQYFPSLDVSAMAAHANAVEAAEAYGTFFQVVQAPSAAATT